MVALLLGLLIIAGVIGLLISGRKNYRQDEQISRMQDELRVAMSQISVDAEMAGFWGVLLDPGLIGLDGTLDKAVDCGAGSAGTLAATWAYGNLGSVDILDNLAAPADANAQFSCIDKNDALTGTDVLAIKRIDSSVTQTIALGEADARDNMTSGYVYLKTNGATAGLFTQDDDATGPTVAALDTLAPPYSYWRYVPKIYYIRSYATAVGDNIPTLCREVLDQSGGAAQFKSECIARGIENLQIEAGFDSNGDGIADQFVEDPDDATLAQVSALRITLLARSEQPDNTYTNAKTYQLTPTVAVKPTDHYYRRSLTTTILVRNPSALRRIK